MIISLVRAVYGAQPDIRVVLCRQGADYPWQYAGYLEKLNPQKNIIKSKTLKGIIKKNLKRPQKYLFIKDQTERKHSKYCKYKTG